MTLWIIATLIGALGVLWRLLTLRHEVVSDDERAAPVNCEDTTRAGLPSVEWTDPRQRQRSLDIEDWLLSELVNGRLTPADYRDHVFDLACRCDPNRHENG
jgi:hypothetical protein